MVPNELKITAQVTGQIGRLQIYGDIGPSWADEQITDLTVSGSLQKLKEGGAKDLHVHINSGGGNVFHGMAIYNSIKGWDRGQKVGIVDGLAASAASLILMACDDIRMSKASLMMIHEPSGYAGGREKDMKKAAERLSKVRDVMVDVYVAKTGHTKAKIEKLLDDETWLTPEQAVSEKFANSVIDSDEEEVEAKINSSISAVLCLYKNVPDQLRAIVARAQTKAPVRAPKENKMELTVLAGLLGLPATASEAEVRSKLVGFSTTSAQVESMRAVAGDMTELMLIAGKPTSAEAKGVIMAWKASHERVAELSAAQARRDLEEKFKAVVATVDAAITAGKIVPAMKEFWIGEGNKNPAMLEAYVAATPVLTAATGVVTPPPAQEGVVALQLSDAEQEKMFKTAGIADPKEKEKIRAQAVAQATKLAKHKVSLHNNSAE